MFVGIFKYFSPVSKSFDPFVFHFSQGGVGGALISYYHWQHSLCVLNRVSHNTLVLNTSCALSSLPKWSISGAATYMYQPTKSSLNPYLSRPCLLTSSWTKSTHLHNDNGHLLLKPVLIEDVPPSLKVVLYSVSNTRAVWCGLNLSCCG